MLLQSVTDTQLRAALERHGVTSRGVQNEAFRELSEVWLPYQVNVLLMTVGAGKSRFLEAIAAAQPEGTRCAILTAENTLVDQYGETFPELNALKGKTRYDCHLGGTCADTHSIAKKFCANCPYACAKMGAINGELTVFNPMSYLANVASGTFDAADVLLIDEAHKLPGFLRQLGTVQLSEKEAPLDEIDLEKPGSLLKFAKAKRRSLSELVDKKRARRAKERARLGLKADGSHDFGDGNLTADQEMVDKLGTIIDALTDNPIDYICYLKTEGKARFIVVEPLRPPRRFVEMLRQSRKIVLTSGTIFPHHIQELVGGLPYSFTELPAPIPAARRRIVCEPAADRVNRDTHPAIIAAKIRTIMERHPTERGIIHATYGSARLLAPMLGDSVITHTAADKGAALARFKSGDGPRWFLASGLSEGADLVGDIARVNIITKLQWPNLGSEYVQRRRKLRDGDTWYLTETLLHLIQAAGRTTRGVDDFSVTYVLDPGLKRLVHELQTLAGNDVTKQRQLLPQYFLDALK